MPGNFRYVPGVQYIAGVTFQSSFGVHEAGTVVKEAEQFENLDVLVANNFLWPYAPDKGYEWLPPHLFNDVRTMTEVKEALAGDPHASAPVEQFPDGKPDVVEQAEFEAEQQLVIREQIKSPVQPGLDTDPGPSPEEVAEEATGGKAVPQKRAVKKANPRNRSGKAES